MNLNFISKLFTKPEEIEDSVVEVVPDIPEKTKTEYFDEAVQEVVISKLSAAIKKGLTEACYTEEEVEQTKAAQVMLTEELTKCQEFDRHYTHRAVMDTYPKAMYVVPMYNSQYDSGEFALGEFNIDKFVHNILKKELSQ